jgi:hypothetical protein
VTRRQSVTGAAIIAFSTTFTNVNASDQTSTTSPHARLAHRRPAHTSINTVFCEQTNHLIINGKGGVGKSFFPTTLVRGSGDRRSLRRGGDSDRGKKEHNRALQRCGQPKSQRH